MTLLDDIHARVPGARVLVPLEDLSVDDILFLRAKPWCACDCRGCRDGWHITAVALGPFTFVRTEKCGNCDEDGLIPYVSLN